MNGQLSAMDYVLQMFALLASGISDRREFIKLDLLGAYYAYNNNDGNWGNVGFHVSRDFEIACLCML